MAVVQRLLGQTNSRTPRAPAADKGGERAAHPPIAVAPRAHACACGGTCPRCQTARDGHLRAQSTSPGAHAVTSDGLRSPSRGLDAATRADMSSRFGRDVGDVRIHVGQEAAVAAGAIDARAYTVGRHIVFGRDQYRPGTSEGKRLLAHELAHVEQQRSRVGTRQPASAGPAEREAQAIGARVASGGRASVRLAAPTVVQADGPAADDQPEKSSQGDVNLQLSRSFIRWWLGTTLIDGDAPTDVPEGGVAPSLTLRSDLFAPLPPDPLWVPPDYGSLYGGFGERGVSPDLRDTDVVMGLYRDRLRLVQSMPDLRSLAPSFIRPLIPVTWRRDIAGALTGATISAGLKRDYMTPLEISDQAWLNMTGASTTIIPFPSISFDLP
jgi:hypothetical protein